MSKAFRHLLKYIDKLPHTQKEQFTNGLNAMLTLFPRLAVV